MKIGLIVPSFSADQSDWCVPALRDFVQSLAADHALHIFALHYPFRRDNYSLFGARVRSLNGRNRHGLAAPRRLFDALTALSVEHARGGFDVLHAFWANEPGFIATLAGRALGIPTVVSVWGGELVGLPHIRYGSQLRVLERMRIRFTLQRATRVTVGSRYLQSIARQRGVKAARVPLGVDTKMFSPSRLREKNSVLKILNSGSLTPVKNQEILLEAFAAGATIDAMLEIVGSGPLETKLRAQANTLGIADRVTFCGELPHLALREKYQATDVMVQASLHEAQGLAVLEAGACSVAIVGTPVGALPEFAASGASITARGFKASDLMEAIQAAFAVREQLGIRARELVEREFALEVTRARWTQVYASLESAC
jgi:glycosyltransferase involved in cell wall biosynthesis